MKTMSIEFNPDEFSLGELTTYQVGAMQAAAHRALKKHGDELLKEYGITSMQWHIIGAVLDEGKRGARISELATKLDTTMAFLTTNVNLLELKGALERAENEKDARSRLIRVAPAFRPKCAEIEKALRVKLRNSIYSRLTPEELHTYIKATAKFAQIDSNENRKIGSK